MFDLTKTRRAPTWVLVAVIAAIYPWSMLVNLWFAAPGNKYYEPLLRGSKGLLWPNLQACLPTVILWIAVWRLAGLRMSDFGWRGRDLVNGLVATAAIWVGCNAVAVAANLGNLRLASDLAETPTYAIGHLAGQLFGNALYEETVYRGFCMVQFLLVFRARQLGAVSAAWLAALCSAIVFALPHIPNRLLKGEDATLANTLGDQTMLVAAGLFLAWVYIRTRNLWWVIGLHSLANYPAVLIGWSSTNAAKGTITLLGLAVTVGWPWLFRRTARPFGT